MRRRKMVMSLVIGITVILGFYNFTSAIDYPTREIELIVGFSAGGSTSMGARIVGHAASEILGRPVIIVNKPGAGGTISGAYVARAKPDGYTLLAANSATNGAALAFRSGLGYSNSDFQFINQYSAEYLAVACKMDAPWKTIKDLIEYAKKNPGLLKCTTVGVGSGSDLLLELIKLEGGDLKIEAVPFKGDGEMFHALLGGHAQITSGYAVSLKGLNQAGKIRILGISSSERQTDFPDVPTFKEQGLEVLLESWYGIGVPAGVPKEIVAKLKVAFGKASQNPETMEMFKKIGFTPVYKDAEAFSKFVKDREEMYFRIAKKTGVKIE